MVASQKEEILGVFDLIGQQEANAFDRLDAAIDVVAQEQVIGLRGKATVFKKPQ